MSEFQYYEFQKIDGRLSEQQMQELRTYSSRANITPSSFINEYHFGSFKGDADAWMDKYFDGYLFLANWGAREVQFAAPAGRVPLETAQLYCSGESASSREKSGKLILTFHSDAEPEGEWLEGGGLLLPMLEIRDEIAQGDLRPLYLGWLIGVQARQAIDSEEEPPVPPNLGDLSGPQKSLVDFLRLGPDLLAVAAQNSPRVQADAPSREERSNWVSSLPAQEKNEFLIRVMEGEGPNVGMELQSRFRRERSPGQAASEAKPRTIAELLSAAEDYREEREREERAKAALERQRQARAAAAARERHLQSLKGRAAQIWSNVETLTATRLPKSYELVAKHLVDLRDLADREGDQADFKKRLADFKTQHSAKKSLMDRLKAQAL